MRREQAGAQGAALHRSPSPAPAAEEQLKPGRHDEWSIHSGHDLTARKGPAWGGGLHDMAMDDATRAVVDRQQAR